MGLVVNATHNLEFPYFAASGGKFGEPLNEEI